MIPNERVVDVSTRIVPLASESLRWHLDNFELFLNAQVGAITQHFGPFNGNSTELCLSLHNEDKEAKEQGKFALKVQVNRLKEAKKQRMNLCGQVEIHGYDQWSQNFYLPLNNQDNSSISFEFPTNLLKEDTQLQFRMQYISRQFHQHFTVNPEIQNGQEKKSDGKMKDNNDGEPPQSTSNIPPISNNSSSSKSNSKSTSYPQTVTKSTNMPLASKQSKSLQTENPILYSMKKTKEKVQHKWTSMESEKKTTEQQTDNFDAVKSENQTENYEIKEEVVNIENSERPPAKLELNLPEDVKIKEEQLKEVETPDTEITEIEDLDMKEILSNNSTSNQKSVQFKDQTTCINGDELRESRDVFSGIIKMVKSQKEVQHSEEQLKVKKDDSSKLPGVPKHQTPSIVQLFPFDVQGQSILFKSRPTPPEAHQNPPTVQKFPFESDDNAQTSLPATTMVYGHHGGLQLCLTPKLITIPSYQKVQPSHKEKSTMTNKPTKNKEQQTNKIGSNYVIQKNCINPVESSSSAQSETDDILKSEVSAPSLEVTTLRSDVPAQKKFKNASTDTLKYQKTKWQQTEDQLLLDYLKTKQNGAAVKAPENQNGASPKTTPSKSNLPATPSKKFKNQTASSQQSTSTKTKWSQTDDFLFVDLTVDLHTYVYSLPIHYMDKIKLHNFLLTLAKFSRLQDVTEVISDQLKYEMAGQFIRQMLKLMDLYEKCEHKDGNAELRLFGQVMEHAQKNHMAMIEQLTNSEKEIKNFGSAAGKKRESWLFNEEDFVMPETKQERLQQRRSTVDKLVTLMRENFVTPKLRPTSASINQSASPGKLQNTSPDKLQPTSPIKYQRTPTNKLHPTSPNKHQPTTPTNFYSSTRSSLQMTPGSFRPTPTTPKRRASANLPIGDKHAQRQLKWKQRQIEEKLDVFWERQHELQKQINEEVQGKSVKESNGNECKLINEHLEIEEDLSEWKDVDISQFLHSENLNYPLKNDDINLPLQNHPGCFFPPDDNKHHPANVKKRITVPKNPKPQSPAHKTSTDPKPQSSPNNNSANLKHQPSVNKNSMVPKLQPSEYENPFGCFENQPMKLYQEMQHSGTSSSPTTTDSGSAHSPRQHPFTSKEPTQNNEVKHSNKARKEEKPKVPVSPRKPMLQVEFGQKLKLIEHEKSEKNVEKEGEKKASLPTPKTPTKRHRVPVRNSQLLQKIQEARTEIANHQNRPESSLLLPVTVLNQMDILNVNLNQCVHEILTNSCSSDLDPLHEFERRLRMLCYQMDCALRSHQQHSENLQHYVDNLRQVQKILSGLETRLISWRRFLDLHRRIPEAQQNFGEILKQMEEERSREAIETLADLDLSLKECRDQIQLTRQSIPLLTTHARRHLLQMEDEQSRLEANCSQMLSQLRFQHQCYPSAGPWLSPKMAVIKIEKISKGAYDENELI